MDRNVLGLEFFQKFPRGIFENLELHNSPNGNFNFPKLNKIPEILISNHNFLYTESKIKVST